MIKKMKRKIMALAMTAAMITTLFAGMTISASAAWTGAIDTTWYDPSSSVTSYTLNDGEDLAGLAAIVNGDSNVLNNASYLDANGNQITAADNFNGKTINLSTAATVDYDLGTSSWTPIGTSSHPFAGTFNGNNQTITWGSSVAGQTYYGIFGYSTGTVKNLNTTGSLTVSGSVDYVSPVVGYNAGIINSVNNGASLTADNAFNIGGIAGFNTGYILNSSNSGAIHGYRKVGGIEVSPI